MGIDVHSLNFLKHCTEKKNFGRTLTLGRQSLYLDEGLTRRLRGRPADGVNDAYCEWLLTERLGALGVESMDYSDYEGATHIHNMNHPVPESMHGQYDTVFDGGTIEHIYNVPQALRNISEMCRVEGQIIHIVPANNMCGHGFWQFSPELFFSLYTESNGYSDTEVYLADMSEDKRWFKVRRPLNGMRAEVKSDYELMVMVRTVLRTRDFSHQQVQQSDYVHRWTEGKSESDEAVRVSMHPVKRYLSGHPGLYRGIQAAYAPFGRMVRIAKDIAKAPKRLKISPNELLDRKNPWLEPMNVRGMF